MKGVLSAFFRLHRYMIFAEKVVLCILLFSMILLSFGQVVTRNLFSKGFMWIDEVLRVEVLWVAFIGAALATEYRQHIKIDVLSNLLGDSTKRKVIDIIAMLFAMLIGCLLFIAAVHYISVEAGAGASVRFQGIPDWIFILVIPYSFFAVVIRCVINIYKIIFGEEALEAAVSE